MSSKTGCLKANKVSSEKAAKKGFADAEAAEDLRRRKSNVHEESDWDMGVKLGRCSEEGRK